VADGTPANGTVVASSGGESGSLNLNGVAIGNEALTLNGQGPGNNGTLQVETAPASFAGPIALATNVAVNLLGTTLTLTGPIGGPGQLGLGNNGTLVLANNANSFTGGVNMHATGLQQSTLIVTQDHALPASTVLDVPAGTTFRVSVAVATFTGLSGAG